MSLGTTATSVDFRDANVNINIINTINVTSAFNKIEVNNAASNIEWTAVNISAIGTVSKGSFTAVDNATILKTSCTFTDMDFFTYLSNSTIITSTFRRCGLITQGGSTITNSTIDSPSGTVGMLASNLNLITGNTFNSDGTGYAVDLGTITSTQSLNWDNTDNGYAGTDGVTGNETIKVSVDTGFTLTINVVSGATTPTVHNSGPGTVSVVSGLVTLTLTSLINLSDVIILQGGTSTVLADVDQGGTTFAYTYSGAGVIDIGIIKPGYITKYIYGFTLATTDASLPIAQLVDRNYLT